MTAPTPDSFLVIALDGPAASGKGTLARRIAEHYGLAHLDTGSLYRAVGWLVREAGSDPADVKAAVAAVARITPEVLAAPALRTAEAGRDASIVAALGPVRAALLDFQRDFASHPPGAKRGAVLDGRDIASVVCPDARVKIFVTASAEARAHRRYLELRIKGPKGLSEEAILADLKERDARDAARKDAPMVRADGAHLLDTTDLSIEAAFAAACAIIDDQLDRGAA
jgi:cytidylate kinase